MTRVPLVRRDEFDTTIAAKADKAEVAQVNLNATSPLSRFAWKLNNASAVKVVAVGDSILEGTTVAADGGVLGTDDALSVIVRELDAAYPAVVTGVNEAVSGRTAHTSFLLGDFGKAIADAADLYIIGFGHNDVRSDSTDPGSGYPKAAMVKGIERMIRRIRDEVPGADIMLMLENPYNPGSGSNAGLVAQAALIRPLAAHYGLALADTYQPFLDYGADWTPLLADTGHPNTKGHRLMADTMLALIPSDGVPRVPVTPTDLYGASKVGRTWQEFTANSSVPDDTKSARYVLIGAWDSLTNAPHTVPSADATTTYARVMFFGDELVLKVECGAGQGVVSIDVDAYSNKYPSIDLSTYPSGPRYIPITGLGDGAHLVTLRRVSGQVKFYGVSARERVGKSLDLSKATLTGTGWALETTPPTTFPGPYRLISAVLGDALTHTFYGTKLTISHNRFSSNHYLEVSVDGGPWVSKSVSDGTAGGAYAATTVVSGLPLGQHTVSIRSTGARNQFTVYDLSVYDETLTGTVADLLRSAGERDTAGLKADKVVMESSYARASAGLRQPVPVATKAHPPADGANSSSTGGVLGGTAKLSHVATRSFYGVRLVYVNWKAVSGSVEGDGANDITVRAAVEPFGNTVVPVTFSGRRSVTIEPGGIVVSDPLGLDIAKGATFSTRTYVEVASGTFPINTIPTASSGEGNNYANPAGADLTAPGSASLTGVGTNQLVYGPAAILGSVADLGKPVVGILGDSIFHGNGDSSFALGGLAQRALNGNYSYQKVAFPGESLGGFLGVGGVGRIRRAGLLALCGVTHIVTDYTVNSLTSTSIQANAATAWAVMRRIAPEGVWATTLTPQTTSTDAWATTANQTVQYPSDREPRRKAFNAWLRDGAPVDGALAPQAVGASGAGIVRAGQAGHPLSGYFEVADLAETARDSGVWKAGYTSDGTHPNATGHAALAAAINPARFGPPSV